MDCIKKRINCILLVDDNPGDNYLNSFTIKEAGVCKNIRTVYDGEQALSYMLNTSEKNPFPDLIFLDINMPRMNGFEFLNKLEMMGKELDTVVVMLTSSTDPNERFRALQNKNVKEFFTKPLDDQAFQNLIKKYFSQN